jgi:hypothetical protein
MMLILDYIIRSAVPVATLALLSSIPAAAQAPKLSPQQLNSPMSNANNPISAPKPYSPNLNKPITAAPVTVQRPVLDNNPRPMAHGSIASGTIKLNEPSGRTYHTAPGPSQFRGADKVRPAIPDPETAARDRYLSDVGAALENQHCLNNPGPGC